jgi:hypothetical protein
MGWASGMNGGRQIHTRFLVGKLNERPLGDLSRSWEESKIELEDGWEGVERLIWLRVGSGGGMF